MGTYTHIPLISLLLFSLCKHLSFFPPPSSLFLSVSAASFPDELGLSVPLTEEEQRELLYVPMEGEWGSRSRSEECERIIKAIDQLCTLGMVSSVLN